MACGMDTEQIADDEAPANRAPVAGDDILVTSSGRPGTINVLVNDRDPDGDPLSVTSFTIATHGAVAIAGAIATYTPVASFSGGDQFTYTLSDSRGMTATGTVNVMVRNLTPGCTITMAGPATGTFGDVVHLTATASCNTGAPEVQWYHKTNSAYVVVQPYGAAQTLDFTVDMVGNDVFYATVRTAGTTPAQSTSNLLTIKTVDNTPQCSLVKMLAPIASQSIAVDVPQTLTAQATCPAGAEPEFQFWVKATGASNWQVLPGYTTGSSSWTPPSAGSWVIRAVARSTGSHVPYQAASMSVTVTAS
jgi:hypothetical protein